MTKKSRKATPKKASQASNKAKRGRSPTPPEQAAPKQPAPPATPAAQMAPKAAATPQTAAAKAPRGVATKIQPKPKLGLSAPATASTAPTAPAAAASSKQAAKGPTSTAAAGKKKHKHTEEGSAVLKATEDAKITALAGERKRKADHKAETKGATRAEKPAGKQRAVFTIAEKMLLCNLFDKFRREDKTVTAAAITEFVKTIAPRFSKMHQDFRTRFAVSIAMYHAKRGVLLRLKMNKYRSTLDHDLGKLLMHHILLGRVHSLRQAHRLVCGGVEDGRQPSRAEVHRFLRSHNVNMSKSKPAPPHKDYVASARERIKAEVGLIAQSALQSISVDSRRPDGYPPELIVNTDETDINLFPQRTHCWTLPEEARLKFLKQMGIADEEALKKFPPQHDPVYPVTEGMKKATTTVVYTADAAGNLVKGQIIFKGVDVNRLCGNWKAKLTPTEAMKVQVRATKTKWITPETLLHYGQIIKKHRREVVKRLYEKDSTKDWDKLPIIWIMDCAPVHTCEEFASILTDRDCGLNARLNPKVREEFKLVMPVFIPARTTGQLQPLDVAFFGPAKKQIETLHLDRVMSRLTLEHNGKKRTIKPDLSHQTFTEYTRQELIGVVIEHFMQHNGKAGAPMRAHVMAAFHAILPSLAYDPQYDVHEKVKAHWREEFVQGRDKKRVIVSVFHLFRHLELTPQFVRAIREEAARTDKKYEQVPFAKSTFTNVADPAAFLKSPGDRVDPDAVADPAAYDSGSESESDVDAGLEAEDEALVRQHDQAAADACVPPGFVLESQARVVSDEAEAAAEKAAVEAAKEAHAKATAAAAAGDDGAAAAADGGAAAEGDDGADDE